MMTGKGTETLFDDFQPGDLLYGMEVVKDERGLELSAPRKTYRDRLRQHNPKLKFQAGCYATIDELNLGETILELLSNFFRVPPDGERDFFGTHSCSQPVQAHLQYLKSNQHGYDFQRFDREGKSKKYMLRHICKATLLRPDVRIHFLLDGIDIARVARKLHNNKIERAFTASELRFIFRKWGKGHGLEERIKFYENGQVVPAPWEPKSSHFHVWRDCYKNTTMANSFEDGYTQGFRASGSEELSQCYLWHENYKETPMAISFAEGYAQGSREAFARRQALEQRMAARSEKFPSPPDSPYRGGGEPASARFFSPPQPPSPEPRGEGQSLLPPNSEELEEGQQGGRDFACKLFDSDTE